MLFDRLYPTNLLSKGVLTQKEPFPPWAVAFDHLPDAEVVAVL